MVCSPDPNITDEDNGVRVVGDRECSSRSSAGGMETPEASSARLSTGGGDAIAGGVGDAPSNSSSPVHSPAASATSSEQTTPRATAANAMPLQPPPFSHMFPFGDR